MNAAKEVRVGFFKLLSTKECFPVEGFRFAKVTFFLPEIGKNADLLDELSKAGRISIGKPPDLLDTAGGRIQLALEVGIHGKKELAGVSIRPRKVGDGVTCIGHHFTRNTSGFIPVGVGVVVEHDVKLSDKTLKDGGDAGVVHQCKTT